MMQKEAQMQEAVFRWAAYAACRYPALKMMYHIPNGGSRNKVEAANLKRQGVKAGVPDICLPVASQGFHGLYIELKVKPNKPTQKQLEWLEMLSEQGYFAVICWNTQAAIDTIINYLKG